MDYLASEARTWWNIIYSLHVVLKSFMAEITFSCSDCSHTHYTKTKVSRCSQSRQLLNRRSSKWSQIPLVSVCFANVPQTWIDVPLFWKQMKFFPVLPTLHQLLWHFEVMSHLNLSALVWRCAVTSSTP